MSSFHNQANSTDTAVNGLAEAFEQFVIGNPENSADMANTEFSDVFEQFVSSFMHHQRDRLFQHFRDEESTDEESTDAESTDAESTDAESTDAESTGTGVVPLLFNQLLVAPIRVENPSGTRFNTIEHFIADCHSRSTKAVDHFLPGLPTVETATLPEDDRSCPICMEKYDSPTTADETEPAVRLQCHHVVGKSCLKTWLNSGNMTCPFCRANVCAKNESVTTPPPPPT